MDIFANNQRDGEDFDRFFGESPWSEEERQIFEQRFAPAKLLQDRTKLAEELRTAVAQSELTAEDKQYLEEIGARIQLAYRPLKTVASVLTEGKYKSGFTKALIGVARTAVAVSLAVYALPVVAIAVSGGVAAGAGGVLLAAAASAGLRAFADKATEKLAATATQKAGLVSKMLRILDKSPDQENTEK